MIRAVLDTNVLISAFIIRHGAPRHIFNAWREGKFELVTSLPILQEVDDVLHRPNIQRKYALGEDDIYAYLLLLGAQAIVVPVLPDIGAVSADPKDDSVLACALVGQAQFVISGDHHLLDLGAFAGAQIVTPREFATKVVGGWQPTLPQIGRS